MNWVNLIKMFLPNLLTFLLTLGSKYLNLQKRVPELEALVKEGQEAVNAMADFAIEFAKSVADGKITQEEIDKMKPKLNAAIRELSDVPRALTKLLK